MNIERIFNPESQISLQDIIQTIIQEQIDKSVQEQYDKYKVNTATSLSKGVDVA